jgi:hypothetical protein
MTSRIRIEAGIVTPIAIAVRLAAVFGIMVRTQNLCSPKRGRRTVSSFRPPSDSHDWKCNPILTPIKVAISGAS